MSAPLLGVGAALVVLDVLVRTARIRQLLSGFGDTVTFRAALALTTVGDAAAALTPWRIGGEAFRVAGARRAGASRTGIAATLATEAALVYPLAALAGLGLAAAYGADWSTVISAGLSGHSRAARVVTVGIAGVALASVLFGLWAPRLATLRTRVGRLVRSTRDVLRRMPRRALQRCMGWSVVSLAARVAVLPLIAAGLPDPPPVGVATFASFVLLHSQLFLPTPSGVGAVELAFAYGGASVDRGAMGVLAVWRALTLGLPLAMGAVVGAVAYGPVVFTLARRGVRHLTEGRSDDERP